MAAQSPTPDDSTDHIDLPKTEWRTAYCPECDRILAIIRGECGCCGTEVYEHE